MDRLTQKETAGRNLINGRYMLNECLFASDLGTLYQARDTRQDGAGAGRVGVLIHFLPNRAIAYNELPGLLPVLQGYAETLDCSVLKVVDYGWSGTVAYFIMLAPESWSVNVLPEMQAPPGSLHQNAVRITRDLLHKGIISTGLVPQAFLVMPGGLYLLPTALTEYFQVLQRPEALLPLKTNQAKSWRWMPILGWGAAFGMVVAGSGHIYYLFQQEEVIEDKPRQPLVGKSDAQMAKKNVAEPVKPDNLADAIKPVPIALSPAEMDRPEIETGTLLTEESREINEQEQAENENKVQENTPETHSDETAGSMSAPDKPDQVPVVFSGGSGNETTVKINPEVIEEVPVSPNIQLRETAPVMPSPSGQQHPLIKHSEPIVIKPVAIEPAPVAPDIPEIEPVRIAAVEPAAIESNHPVLSVSVQKRRAGNNGSTKENVVSSDKPVGAKSSPDNLAQKRNLAAAQKKPVAKKNGRSSPRLTANGFTSEQLIDSAYKAIRSGQLGEAAGRGAIYYIRLVKRIDRGNPQINRMARKVVSAYHVKTRVAIRNNHKRAAHQLLWIAGRIIKEFNLTTMNKPHEILTHRLAE